jgi:hypothetical protein
MTSIYNLIASFSWAGPYFINATYTHLVSDHIQWAIDVHPNLDRINGCKSFTIDDTITFIKAALDDLKAKWMSFNRK